MPFRLSLWFSQNAYAGEYLVGKETWKLDAMADRLIFKSGRLVPIEFIPVSETEFVNRFMDMKLAFPDNFAERGEFSFHVQGQEVLVRKKLN